MKAYLARQTFDPTLLGIVLNPYYIVRRRINEAVKRFAANACGDLLDVGCGSRPYEHHFKGLSTYTGLDIEESGHPHEKKRADVYYDGKTIPFGNNSMDVVFIFEVIEHIFNIDDVIKEIHRVLKKDGTIFLTIPFAFPEHEVPYDFARYTQFGIRHILCKNGFEVRSTEKLGTMVHAIGQMKAAYWFAKAKSAVAKFAVQILFCAPITVATELKGLILPRDDRYYCGLVVEAVAIK